MEDLIIAAVLVLVLAIPGAIIYLLVKVAGLSRKIGALEADLSALAAARPSGPGAAPGQAPALRPAAEAARQDPARSDTGPWEQRSQPSPADPQDPVKPARRASPLPAPVVSGPSLAARATDWLAANWFYVVAAASLALAGIFLIQYGVERGLLPPPLRVAAALAFGAALIGAGEWLRRKWGDGEDVATAYLPSVFSGAGVVTLFAAILGARHLYDLFGPTASLAGLAFVALGAVVLGWFHGPLLIAIGLVGGALAPFVVGGESDDPSALHAYFALLGFVGLAIDAVRRWPLRWVSGLALAAGMGGSFLLWLVAAETTLAHLGAVLALTLGALSLPLRRLRPDHGGPMVTEVFAGRATGPITPESILATLSVAAATVLAARVGLDAGNYWPAALFLLALVAAVALWSRDARATQDAAILPAAALLLLTAHALPGTPSDVTWALIAGAALSVFAYGRSVLGAPAATHSLAWPLAAVLAAPSMGLVLHLAQDADARLGTQVWSLHAMAVAALLTGFAGVWAARDGDNRLRASLAALLAFTVIGYGIGQIAGEAALTVAIAGMAALGAWLDRQFRLPLLAWFVVLAAPFTGWRLLAEPGWDWALDGPLGLVVLSFGGALAGFAAAWWMLRGRDRLSAEVTAETAVLSIAGLSAILFIWRGLDSLDLDTLHMRVGLIATIWLLLAWVQLERRRRTETLKRLRLGLAAAFGFLALCCLVFLLTVVSPLMDLFGTAVSRVRGPVVLNTLIPGYLVPALMLLAFRHRWVRWAGLGLAGVWAVLTIRHFWAGAEGMPLSEGSSQPEIMSYTALMLLIGGLAFYQGIAARSDLWRRVGLVVLGVTAAKVFLIDAASLTGLLRVGAFVALALSLAALAWLNRWAGGAGDGGGQGGDGAGSRDPRPEDGQADR